jgi:hypothetical protein
MFNNLPQAKYTKKNNTETAQKHFVVLVIVMIIIGVIILPHPSCKLVDRTLPTKCGAAGAPGQMGSVVTINVSETSLCSWPLKHEIRTR